MIFHISVFHYLLSSSMSNVPGPTYIAETLGYMQHYSVCDYPYLYLHLNAKVTSTQPWYCNLFQDHIR